MFLLPVTLRLKLTIKLLSANLGYTNGIIIIIIKRLTRSSSDCKMVPQKRIVREALSHFLPGFVNGGNPCSIIGVCESRDHGLY